DLGELRLLLVGREMVHPGDDIGDRGGGVLARPSGQRGEQEQQGQGQGSGRKLHQKISRSSTGRSIYSKAPPGAARRNTQRLYNAFHSWYITCFIGRRAGRGGKPCQFSRRARVSAARTSCGPP